jgi:hypothetical protein
MSKGGSFCKFGVGRSGNSCRHLRYIARLDAVLDRRQGVFLKDLPDLIARRTSYPALVRVLCHYARLAEATEIIEHKSRGLPRTHYCATLSFERELECRDAGALVLSWLKLAFPLARAAVFLHCNTNHLHAHVWISARQTDGTKVNLSARAFRQLDEIWNKIYAHAMGQDEREYLLKKWETEHYKRLRREGKDLPRPERAAQNWHPAAFTERERKRLGADYERQKSGVGGDKPEIAGGAPVSGSGEPEAPGRQPPPDHAALAVQWAVEDSERAVSATHELCDEVAHVVEREIERER